MALRAEHTKTWLEIMTPVAIIRLGAILTTLVATRTRPMDETILTILRVYSATLEAILTTRLGAILTITLDATHTRRTDESNLTTTLDVTLTTRPDVIPTILRV